MRSFLLAFMTLFVSLAAAQTVRGKLLDKKTGQPLPNALVLVKGKLINTITDQTGRFQIKVPYTQPTSTLVITLLGYYSAEFEVDAIQSDTFFLIQKSIELREVVIAATKKNIVNKKSDESILDFDLLNDQFIYLSAAPGHNLLKLINESGETQSTLKVNPNTDKLNYDCVGNLQLFSKDSTWQIYYDFVKLNNLNAYHITTYNSVLGNCVCSDARNYYFQTLTYKNLRTEFFYYNVNEKGKPKPLVKFENKEKVKFFQKDYDLDYFLRARRASHYTMYAEPLDVMKQKLEIYREQVSLDWEYSKLLGSVETQMLKVDTSLYLVNFTDTSIFVLGPKAEVIPVCKLEVYKEPGLEAKVYVDVDFRETYLVKYSESRLDFYKFDLRSGKYLSKSSLEHVPFLPKKILIKSGAAYFMQKNLADEQVYKLVKYYLD